MLGRLGLGGCFAPKRPMCAGLLCLKTARSGGESSWSSSVSVHNELLRLGRADLVEALAGDWWVDRKVGCECWTSRPSWSNRLTLLI